MTYNFPLMILLLSFTNVSFALTEENDDVHYLDKRDPLEEINREVWDFNYNVMDKKVYRPVAHFYSQWAPDVVQVGVSNSLSNLDEPSNAVNNLLQGKFSRAVSSGGRFAINSTLGIAGLFDVATMLGISEKSEEFGEVLSHYGSPSGPYLMLPFFGPTTVQDGVGDYVDELYFPFITLGAAFVATKYLLNGLSDRTVLIEQEYLLEHSLDPYVFVREGYYQYLSFRLYDEHPPSALSDDDVVEDYLDEIE